jgi:16S rRNA (adenine1518-N6/adenine1519-N6)-dimethyltransferase
MRRKTLWNNLITAFGKDDVMKEKLTAALENVGIDPRIRAEKLSLEEFINLHNSLVKYSVYSK